MNVRPSHLLDAGLWKKLGLEVARGDEPALITTLRRAAARSS